MTDNAEFDRLVEALPQVRRCHFCGVRTPFIRLCRRPSDASWSEWACFYCKPPTLGELRVVGTTELLPPSVVQEQANYLVEIAAYGGGWHGW